MAIKNKKKGIYCIEGLWEPHDVTDKSSVLPILELLEKREACKHVYHHCTTREELEFFLVKWRTKTINSKFPILYLAFHGEAGCIHLRNKEKYYMDELAEILKDKCSGKVIYFGSCSTLNMDKRKAKSFLIKTGAITAIGYKSEVDWIQSIACDLFVFEALQHDKLDSKGIEKIYNKIKSDYGNLHELLGLSVVINDRTHFPRKRMKV